MKRSLVLLLALLLVFTLAAVGCQQKEEEEPAPQERPAFTPPPFDETAVDGYPVVPAELNWGEAKAEGAYAVSICSVVRVVDGKADIYLTNYANSTVWVKVRALDASGKILGETGLIKPGQYVQTITFTTPPAAGDTIRMKVMGYVPDTYQSAGAFVLNTVIS